MNKKRNILLLLIALMMPFAIVIGKKRVEFDDSWMVSTRTPLELPFEASVSEDRMLCLHFISDGTFALYVKDLNGQDVYTTVVSAVSCQDVYVDFKQLPKGTYVLILKNERVEAKGYMLL